MTDLIGRDAVRRRLVPDHLVGKSVSLKVIREWARKQLDGQESSLSDEDCKSIRSGALKEVTLRPRRSGFYAPDGQFIEAFDTRISFGEDLGEHEAEWDRIEADWRWVDEENGLFNKTTFKASSGKCRLMWEHGKRIIDYAKAHGRPYSSILKLLDKRKPPDGYARHTHQTCLDFYWWSADLNPNSEVFSWSWERVDSILRFSNKPPIRNLIRNLIESTALGSLNDEDFSRCLGVKTRREDANLSPAMASDLKRFRGEIGDGHAPSTTLLERCVRIVGQGNSVG